MENPDAKATEGSPACGDTVKIYLKINKKNRKIENIKFESYGCASNIATASITTEMAKGKTIEEAKKIQWKEAADALGGLPPVKIHCAVLAVDALKTAIENYENQHNLLKEKKPTTEEVVRNRLGHVIDPMAGLDVIRTGLAQKIKVDNGKVEIWIKISPDHQFANNIKEEIKERIEPLWDVKEVDVIFGNSA